MVVTKNEKQSKINKTTTINFALGGVENAQALQANITFDLSVTPTIIKDEKLDLTIHLKVSIPTGEGGDSPRVTSNEVQSQLIVANKESAVIGGVVQNQTNTSYDKNPPGGPADEKALFNFVRSKNYSINRNQYVVFVTPEIIESASKGVEEVKRKFRSRSR